MGVSEIGREKTQINEVTAEEFNAMALSLFILEIALTGRGKNTIHQILGRGESNHGDRAILHCEYSMCTTFDSMVGSYIGQGLNLKL
jgi:hypothetical protein